MTTEPSSLVPAPFPSGPSGPLVARIRDAIDAAGGWLPFDRYMALALYAPGLGYYSRSDRQFGHRPQDGSDFVTAPEISPHFGRALARQVAQALAETGTDEVWEFGAGTGRLASQLLSVLQEFGRLPRRYTIVDLSGSLRARQRATLAAWGDRVQWLDRLPPAIEGVVVGNEVLDAMPVQLLAFDGERWRERGVVWGQAGFGWMDRLTDLKPPFEPSAEAAFVPGTLTEIHPQGEAFVRTLASTLQRGAAFFIDYGFPEAEYYHPQRTGGTLMCHRGHLADADPLADVGHKDITAHVNFTGVALAGQDAGLTVLGYAAQARFLVNCGLLEDLQGADTKARAAAHMLIAEHEMGELFKVIGFVQGTEFDAVGFATGDRSHTL